MAWGDDWNSEAGGGMLYPGIQRGDEYYNDIAMARAQARAEAEAAERAVLEARARQAAQDAQYAAALDGFRMTAADRAAAPASAGVYVPGYGVVDAALDPTAAGFEWRGNLPGPLPRGTWADYTYANNRNPAPGIVFGGMGGAQHLVGYPSSNPLVLQTGLIDTAGPFLNWVYPLVRDAWAYQDRLGLNNTGGGGRNATRSSGMPGKATTTSPRELTSEAEKVLEYMRTRPQDDVDEVAILDYMNAMNEGNELYHGTVQPPAAPPVLADPQTGQERNIPAAAGTTAAVSAAALAEGALAQQVARMGALQEAIKRGMASNIQRTLPAAVRAANALPPALASRLGLVSRIPALAPVAGYLTARSLLSSIPAVRQVEDAYGDYLRYGGEDDMYVDPTYIDYILNNE